MHNLKFGIEIEAEGAKPSTVYNFLLARFPEGHDNSYKEVTIGGVKWRMKSDGSLSCGTEITSGIMSEDSMGAIKTIVPLLKKVGLSGRNRAGLHIHVGVPKMKLEDSRRLFMDNWRRLLPRIKRVYSPRKERRGYAVLLSNRYDWLQTRTMALNITQANHETVEYRIFNSQLDCRYITRAIRFACDFTHLTLEGRKLQTKPGESLEAMFKRENELLKLK